MQHKTIATIAATALATLLASTANADALQDYKTTALAGIDACQMVMNDNMAMARMKMKQPGGMVECLAEKKAAIKAAYDAGSKATKPAARAPLKEHLIGTFSALESIRSLTNESEEAYEARKRAREARLIDLWARVEIEL